MATLLLQAAGSLLGGAFGATGAAIGTAAGAALGYAVDQTLFRKKRHVEGARLSGARPMSAEEGGAIAHVHGYARVAGTVIWATRLLERSTTERRGGKGLGGARTTVTTYSYYGNVAVGLCEGPVAAVKRVWADGIELDLRDIDMRVYHGNEDQQSDPLIVAKQGAGNAPAYRGLAYAVFDDLPLERFGNRIPQFTFEVVRPVGMLERQIRGVCVIPGATEYGLSPTPVLSRDQAGETIELNRHILHGESDWTASMDELQALCPNLEHVSLVVAWYGDDLRAGHCRLRPGIVEPGEPAPWEVAGIARTSPDVHIVSRTAGRANYGGTPDDATVVAAIQDLKARGLKVTLNPFILMDVPAGNTLPDPWGASAQSPHPWRGRITCHPAPGQPGTTDRTAAAAADVQAFAGTDQDFGYRHFILHHARLAALAGGVDAFLVGSEMRSLTQVRDAADAFPFVDVLTELSDAVKAIAGASTKITYGADWSEYFGYQPADGSGDVYYHLDTLWAHGAIDAVGIDNYMPISDWRDEDAAGENPDGAESAHDIVAHTAGVTRGEGHDWYYASRADRDARIRTPITDGAHGKPWVFRFKDLRSWWENRHFERRGGVELPTPTAWQPRMKQVWFTEIGCPAVDKGATRPNVFADPKSSENALPWHSTGARDDMAQRVFLEAVHDAWTDTGQTNPLDPVSGTPMVDPYRLYVWAWDARPLPAFPLQAHVWGDGDNWLRGHWLNGRLGTAPAGDLVSAVLQMHGHAVCRLRNRAHASQGAIFSNAATPRAMLEPVLSACGLAVHDGWTNLSEPLCISWPAAGPARIVSAGDRVIEADGDEPGDLGVTLAEDGSLPSQIILNHRDGFEDYRNATRYSRRIEAPGSLATIDLPLVMDGDTARRLAGAMLDDAWGARMAARFALPLRHAALRPGDVIAFDDALQRRWLIRRIEITDRLSIEAVSVPAAASSATVPVLPDASPTLPSLGAFGGPPQAVFLDLPVWEGADPLDQFRVAVRDRSASRHVLYASPGGDDLSQRATVRGNAIIGTLVDALPPARVAAGRFDHATTLDVAGLAASLSGREGAALLAGGNALALRTNDGTLEIIQFAAAEEIAPSTWRLGRLLRGQAGTEQAAASGAASGADVVLLDSAVTPVGLRSGERGLALAWRYGPVSKPVGDRYFGVQTVAGGIVASTPLAPVHLQAGITADGAVAVRWIRRTRIDGDSWQGLDVPLGEEREAYRVRLVDASGTVLSEAEVGQPFASVAPPPGATPGTIEIAQISQSAGPGYPARIDWPAP